MTTIWVISDTHFGHANILNFKRDDGTTMRVDDRGCPFVSVEAMDEYMIEKWNSVVRSQDHVYHLGDVALHKRSLPLLDRLNGHLRLVRGNHDIAETKEYMKYFDDIYGVRVIDGLIMSHIPLHPDSLKWWTNVHGHLHNNETKTSYTPRLGPRYFNASVEVLNYIPVTLEQIKAQVNTWTK